MFRLSKESTFTGRDYCFLPGQMSGRRKKKGREKREVMEERLEESKDIRKGGGVVQKEARKFKKADRKDRKRELERSRD